MLCLAALVTVEAQLLILMGEALEHPQVHEVLIPNMDLQSTKASEIPGGGAACSTRGGRGWAGLRMEQLRGSKKKHCLVLNHTRSHDFEEIPPNLPMKMEKRGSLFNRLGEGLGDGYLKFFTAQFFFLIKAKL